MFTTVILHSTAAHSMLDTRFSILDPPTYPDFPQIRMIEIICVYLRDLRAGSHALLPVGLYNSSESRNRALLSFEYRVSSDEYRLGRVEVAGKP
jgi:hypothetical protein